MTDEPRDRNFGPAVRAAIERAAASHSTDPRWDAKAGGLPEPPRGCSVTFGGLHLAVGRAIPLGPESDGVVEIMPSTITPPHAEPPSLYVRAKIETALRLMEEAVAEMRRVRDGQP